MDSHNKVLVIGAGVSGLVTLKTMKRLGIDCVIYEANDYHGGLWHYNEKTYGVMEFTFINVSRYNYAFSDFPYPEKSTDFAHHSDISRYIDSYVEHFDLAENIRYNTRVVHIARTDGKESTTGTDDTVNWTITYESGGETFTSTCEYLVVATGHHVKPKIPKFTGEDKFKGEIIHSVKYKDVHISGYQKKNVVLIGIGNSSVDIADNLVSKGRCQVSISTRSGAWVFPNYWFGIPAELHIHRVAIMAGPFIRGLIFRFVIWLSTGHPNRWGLNPKYGPSETHPTVSPTLIHHIQRGGVRIVPNIKEIGEDYVEFEDGSRAEDIGAIIKCTGYTIHLPYLEESVRNLILIEETNDLKMYHAVFSPELGPTLAMIGYIQPIGSLIMISEMQAQWLGMIITGKCSLPSKNDMKEKIVKDKMSQAHYKKSTRHTIQREPIAYCDEISSYFGARPLMKNHMALAPRLMLGSGGAAQWTLQGPYYNPKAAEIVRKVPVPAFSVYLNLLLCGIFFYCIYLLFSFVAYCF